jgi:hypothetical protein
MLLEEQNKKRLMQAGQGRDGPHQNQGFVAPNMSPSGSRGAVPSPGPSDQIKRLTGTPKIPQQNLAGSPMADMQNRASPAPNFDPNTPQMPGGMPQAYYATMGNNPMARAPPSSHPNFNAMGMAGIQQQTLQQMQRMASENNGRVPGSSPWPPGMQGGPNSALRPGQGPGAMGPPPTPAGEQAPPQRPQPSSPAQNPAPPTPSQTKASVSKASKKENGNKKVSFHGPHTTSSLTCLEKCWQEGL